MMRKWAWILTLLVAGAAGADEGMTGRWVFAMDVQGVPQYFVVELVETKGKLSGDFAGDKLEGTVKGSSVEIFGKDDKGGTEKATGTLSGAALSGNVVIVFAGGDASKPQNHKFTMTRAPRKLARAPKRIDFVPTAFYREFSRTTKPVATIGPGDTVHTTTVDAGGNDEKGVNRSLGGNPQTGPFYVETAVPGDTLVVHVTKLRTNRDYAVSDDFIVPRAMSSRLAVDMKDGGKQVRWKIDAAKGVATSELPGDHLKSYTVPLRPMLGCIAVAPPPFSSAVQTGDSGGFGGNLDMNEIVEGATVYLPVNNPGALFYLGDGHAAQGDGELNGDALETSLDVEFTVEVLNKAYPGIFVESPTHFIATGYEGSLDDAFKTATGNMARFLTEQYKLSPSEVAQVLGTAAEYRVTEVADRNAGMALRIAKERLKDLPK